MMELSGEQIKGYTLITCVCMICFTILCILETLENIERIRALQSVEIIVRSETDDKKTSEQ